MNTEINTQVEQNNEFANQPEEGYYQYLANMKFSDTEDYGEDFGVAFMFL